MSELTPELAAEIVAACGENAEEAAGALSRALDGEFVLKPGEAVDYDAAKPPEDFAGPGLAVLFTFDGVGAVAMLPTCTGLAPDWCSSPGATGESKLSTLGRELSVLLVPDSLTADGYRAQWVDNLAEAASRGAPAEGAKMAPLEIAVGDNLGVMSLVWPLEKPADFWGAPSEESAIIDAPPADVTDDESKTPPPMPPTPRPKDYSDLPPYCVSLLQIEAPLTVTLASKRQSVEDILGLTNGAIISFDKSCDSLLELWADGRPIALGSAVKVGERFGLRIAEMLLPDEQFAPVQRPPRDA